MEVSIFARIKRTIDVVKSKSNLLYKKIRNRTPEGLRDFLVKNIIPYASIIIVALFVLISNYVSAAESNAVYVPNEQLMDMDPADIAKTVNAINPYTPNFEEDTVQVVLAMKDEDYLGKPIITETAQTAAPVEDRKSMITYTVQGSDTLSSIGWKYGLKISSIKASNNLSSDLIKPGQQLKIPTADLAPSYLASLQAKRVAGTQTRRAFAGTFGRPTTGWNMSQGFGRTSFENWHTGVDLTSRSGLVVKASASGTIIKVTRGWGGGYGNHIVISHGNGFTTLYGHMSSFTVSQGQWVNQGQQIGVMGNTGWSTGTHVRFEIRKNNSPQNPLSYL